MTKEYLENILTEYGVAFTDSLADRLLKEFEQSSYNSIKTELKPCEDMVSRGVFEQVMWERDVAIEQLEELGYELGEKIEPCEDAISRQAVLNTLYALCDTGETLIENPWRDNPHIDAVVEIIEQLPSVNPQYTQDKIQKMQELEQAEIEKAYELGKAEIERDDMAIKALEQSSYNSIKTELNGDTISRQ